MINLLGRIVIGLMVITCFSLPAEAGVTNQVVAVVGEDVITLMDLNKLIGPHVERLRSQGGTGLDRKIAQMRTQALEQLIVERLAVQEAARLGIKVTKADVDSGEVRVLEMNKLTKDQLVKSLAKDGMTYEEFRDKIKTQILRARLVFSQVKAKVMITEEEKKALYNARRDEYETFSELVLNRILLPREKADKAEEILISLKGGAEFGQLAKLFSTGPEAKDGGRLGKFKAEQLSEIIRNAVENLAAGGVSGIVETRDGLQIFQVEEIVTTTGKTFEEMEAQLEEELMRKELDEKFGEWITKVRRRSYVKIMEVKQ